MSNQTEYVYSHEQRHIVVVSLFIYEIILSLPHKLILNEANMNSQQLYYVCVRKEDNKMVICTGKTSVRSFTGVSADTLRRNNNSSIYENKEFTIYIGIELLNRNNKSCDIIHKKMKQRKTTNNLSKQNDLPHIQQDVPAKSTIIPTIKPKGEFDLF